MMDGVSILLLCITVMLSVGRNLLSKNVSVFSFGTKPFFAAQAMLFLGGGVFLCLLGTVPFCVSALTVLHAALYGVLLISAQWCYTAALGKGNTGICATVYSLGFILPTLAGTLFWHEPFTVWQGMGAVCVIPALICSGMRKKTEQTKGGGSVPLLCAMLSSGGLGIMQKVQQNGAFPEQKPAFVCMAFLLAGAVSLAAMLSVKGEKGKMYGKKAVCSVCAGICFAGSNLLNTTLAGRLPGAVLFPILNIGVILLSLLSGIILYREKCRKTDFAVLFFSILAIICLNI